MGRHEAGPHALATVVMASVKVRMQTLIRVERPALPRRDRIVCMTGLLRGWAADRRLVGKTNEGMRGRRHIHNRI